MYCTHLSSDAVFFVKLLIVAGEAQAKFLDSLSKQDAAARAAKDEIERLKGRLSDLSPRYDYDDPPTHRTHRAQRRSQLPLAFSF